LDGTFRDYLPMVLEHPKLAQLATRGIYEMVRSYGVDLDDQANERFHSSRGNSLDRRRAGESGGISESSRTGSDVGKRVLMLYAPSSGKSQL